MTISRKHLQQKYFATYDCYYLNKYFDFSLFEYPKILTDVLRRNVGNTCKCDLKCLFLNDDFSVLKITFAS